MSIQNAYNFVAINEQVTTSGLPTLEQLQGLQTEAYSALINLLPDDNEYAVAGEREALAAQDLEYIYIPVDYLEPKVSDFAEFTQAMERLAGARMHIHCAANYRVSVFYGLYAYLKGWWTRQQMDQHIHSLFRPEDYPPWPQFIDQVLSIDPIE